MNWFRTPPARDADRAPPTRARRVGRWLLEIGIVIAVFVAAQAWMTRDVLRGALPALDAPLINAGAASARQWSAMHGADGFVLYVWATWCPICRTIEGSIDAVAQDVPVLTVAMSSGDEADVERFLQLRGHRWATLIDGDGQLSGRLGVAAVPTLLFVDRRGVVRAVTQGYTTEAGIRLRWWWLRTFD